MSKNLRFRYLYRDAGNNKYWGEIVFANPDEIRPAETEAHLMQFFLTDGLFIADQVRIPEVFPYADAPTEEDHCYHEFDRIEETDEAPDDEYSRSMREFLAEVEYESKKGWKDFIPGEPRDFESMSESEKFQLAERLLRQLREDS